MKKPGKSTTVYLTETRRQRLEQLAAELEAQQIPVRNARGDMELVVLIDYLLDQHEQTKQK